MMATSKITADIEEEESPKLVDNTLSLRSRQVERNETDPSFRTHIGPWGTRSTSEPRVSDIEKGYTGSEEKGARSKVSIDELVKLVEGEKNRGVYMGLEGVKKETNSGGVN